MFWLYYPGAGVVYLPSLEAPLLELWNLKPL